METYSIREKVAIVTGASRGIGRAIATMLASEGVFVAVTARSEERLRQLQHDIESAGGLVHSIVADLADPLSAQYIVSQAVTKFGHLDILIGQTPTLENCAAKAGMNPFDVFQEMGNFEGFFFCLILTEFF